MQTPPEHGDAILCVSLASSTASNTDASAQNRHRDALSSHNIQKVLRRLPLITTIIVGCVITLSLVQSRYTANAGTPEQWRQLAPGFESRLSVLIAPSTSLPVPFHAIRLDPTRYTLRVLDSRIYGERALSAVALAERTNALAAINANFFLEDFSPLGLILTDGELKNPVRKVDWGVFAVSRSGNARIEHTRNWQHRNDDEFAIQAGPRLIVDGKTLTLKPNLARRSALCIDTKNRVLLVATSGLLLLDEFAILLQKPQENGGFDCYQALNLDGGSSTQLHVAIPDANIGVASDSPIPIAVGVFARSIKEPSK